MSTQCTSYAPMYMVLIVQNIYFITIPPRDQDFNSVYKNTVLICAFVKLYIWKCLIKILW